MGIFDNLDLDDINKVKDRAVFVRFSEGVSVCQVTKTGAMKSFKTKQPLFLVDFKVLETTDKGLTVGEVVNYAKNPLQEWGLKELRNFLVAAAGLIPGNEEDQPIIDKTDWAAAIRTASNNPSVLAGATVQVTGEKGTGKESGRDYIKLSFVTTNENRQRRIDASKKSKK